MATKSGPNIIPGNPTDLYYSMDAGSERCFSRSELAPYWADYSASLQAGRYTLPTNDSVYIRNTYAGWIGRFEAIMADSAPYTIMFDHVSDASSQIILDNDAVDDNQWNATISSSTTKQTYSFTRTPAQTSASTKIQFYLRRNSGGNIHISNFRFFKHKTISSIAGKNTLGFGYAGTFFGSPDFFSTNGGTFDFDGTNDYITTAYNKHNQTTGTIEAWVKLATITGNRYAFGVGGTSTVGASRCIRVSGSNWSVVTYGSANTQDWNDIANATTAWTHIGVGWSGTTLYFYLNGERSSFVASGIVTPTGSILRIGCEPWATSSLTDGQVALLRHHSTVLTEEQMKSNFNAQKNRFI